MRISLTTAMAVVVSCGVLHNIAILENSHLPDEKYIQAQKKLPIFMKQYRKTGTM